MSVWKRNIYLVVVILGGGVPVEQLGGEGERVHALLADGPRPQLGLGLGHGLLPVGDPEGSLAVDGGLADGAVAAQQVLVQPRV